MRMITRVFAMSKWWVERERMAGNVQKIVLHADGARLGGRKSVLIKIAAEHNLMEEVEFGLAEIATFVHTPGAGDFTPEAKIAQALLDKIRENK